MAAKIKVLKYKPDLGAASDAEDGEMVKIQKAQQRAAKSLPREEQLQAAVDQEIGKMAKAVAPLGERAQYLQRLFAKRAAPVDTIPLVPLNKAFNTMQAKAAKLHKADPSKTIEQHFAALAEDPRNSELFQKAVRINVDWDDPDSDDDDDETDADSLGDDDPGAVDYPMLDPVPANEPSAGMARPTSAEARTNSGRATSYTPAAVYRDGDNTLQDPRGAVVGRSDNSDQNSRLRGSKNRPNAPGVTSAEGQNPTMEKRIRKILSRKPDLSRIEAAAIATAPDKVRKVLVGALTR